MYQGFYDLASGMLSQSKTLDVITNNLINSQTVGYKNDTVVSSTFREEMLYRTGRHNKGNAEQLAETSKIRSVSRSYVNHEQGSFEMTGGIYDFAIGGKGFFTVLLPGGRTGYTRNGSFSVDNEGFLMMNGVNRVLSTEGQPIQIDNENFTVDESGMISALEITDSNGERTVEVKEYGRLGVVDFADYAALNRDDNGVFTTNQVPTGNVAVPQEGAEEGAESTVVLWQQLEKSNVNMIDEMTGLISAQRALQSAAQMIKMYDSVMSKSVSDVGRV